MGCWATTGPAQGKLAGRGQAVVGRLGRARCALLHLAPRAAQRVLARLAPFAALLAAAATPWLPGPALAQEPPTREALVHIARLHYDGGGDWYSNPSSNPNWMRGFQERTGIPTVFEEVQVRPTDDALYHYPIAYMNGHGNVSFSDEDARAQKLACRRRLPVGRRQLRHGQVVPARDRQAVPGRAAP